MVDITLSTEDEQALGFKRLRISNKTSNSLLLGLPVELVSYILSLLDPEHVTLFSLTCKAASILVRGTDYGKICLASVHSALHTNSGLASFQRATFLHHLAKDLPHRFVCKRCSKFHQKLVNLAEEGPDALSNSISIHRQKDLMMFGPLWPQYAFTREHGRQAVRDSSIGSEPNYATSHLAISTDWKLRRLGTSCNNPDFIHGYVKLDTEAVVVNGKLYFHKIQRIVLLPDRLKPFLTANRSSPMEQVFQSCCHGTEFRATFRPSLDMLDWNGLRGKSVHDTITKFANVARAGLPLLMPLSGLDKDTIKRYPPLPIPHAGCKHCMTEELTTIHNHGRDGVEIVSDVFQNLGSCTNDGTDNEWGYCWSGLSYDCRTLKSRRKEHPLIHPGVFPTRPGASARDHPSAPNAKDIWELHDRDREARSQ
ncbi:uncharacterized protein F4812DRAFT_441860 [Daldinia caldariorum]|uniref:uncharacterized protein n=1 Tax=Daldinia caldariorum TaxID=326644 RepID=UPI0020073067|nr:uncharacterized protein F4812DRAFT_441860 [Daldinia caldariorum]KAI1464747.1 hypothetical protein F4812DRAFT_441860 [Daldinia caldariorum]